MLLKIGRDDNESCKGGALVKVIIHDWKIIRSKPTDWSNITKKKKQPQKKYNK